jgi:Terminase RNaseH-like domain
MPGWRRERPKPTSLFTRMESGRFKVFAELYDWFDEFRLFHRRDGKVVKERDDLMSATRYAVMLLRYAKTTAAYDSFNRDIQYPKMGFA